ncbi:MAG: hypothetical protein ACOY3L_09115 [Pseudomonadota bacterium]
MVAALALVFVLGMALHAAQAAAMSAMATTPAKCQMESSGKCDDAAGKMSTSSCATFCLAPIAVLPALPAQPGPIAADFVATPPDKAVSHQVSPDPSPPRSRALI